MIQIKKSGIPLPAETDEPPSNWTASVNMSDKFGNVVPILPIDDGRAPVERRFGRPEQASLPERLNDTCAKCILRALCVPGGIAPDQLAQLDEFVAARRRVPRGAMLYQAGDEFRSFHAIRSGTFKTCVTQPDGGTQVTGFQLAGELLGLDGVAFGRYGVDAVALEDSEICVLPYLELERIAREFAPLQQQLHRIMSREIVREQGVMVMLGSLSAEQRVASFVVGLSERYRQLGYSPVTFVLRMTREEIGNYLGIKIETVSRAFTKLDEQGLLRVRGKQVDITDSVALWERLGSTVCSGCWSEV